MESNKLWKNEKLEFNYKYDINGLEILNKLNNESMKISFFDPQYRGVLDKLSYGNEGLRQKGRFDLIQMSNEIIKDFIKEIDRVLVKSGYLFLWIDKFHLCEGSVNEWIKDTNLKNVDMIVWNKEKMGMGYRSRKQCEYLLVLQKLPLRAKGTWINRSIRDIWSEKIVNKIHPHQKPINLISTLIESTTKVEDIVLDVAAGSFIVLEACKNLKRNFLGSDLTKENEIK